MRKYMLTILLISLCAVILYGQKRQSRSRGTRTTVITVYDPCMIPQPGKIVTPPLAINNTKNGKCVIPGVPEPKFPMNKRFSNPRGFASPILSIQIRLASTRINSLNDLKFTMDMANNTPRRQTFLFDRHIKDGTFLFGAACYITNSKDQSILKYVNKAVFDTVNYFKNLDSYYYTLSPSEWLIKQFSVKDLVVLDSSICKKGRIPRDRYKMRLVFQGNYSNEVEFVAE